MNNGDKLRQMTNEEMAGYMWHRIFHLINGEDGYFTETILNYLNTEVETTGHEDLEKLNFMFAHECHHNNLPQEEYIQYRHRFNDGIFRVYRESMQYNIDWIGDELIDKLRKCADKIRKEKGWVK